MFKKYPFTKQQNNKDCGVATLQMIIKYYKGYINLEELRNLTKTTKNGTSAYHLIETAKEIGFEAHGVKCKLDQINKNNLTLPCIAHVNLNNQYSHYVVIYEINFKKKTLLIADPASKIYKMTFNQFEKIWNNVLILLYPVTNIPFNKNEISLITFIKNLYNKKILKIIYLSIITTILSITTSLYFKFMTDNIIINSSKNKLKILFISFILITLIKIITLFIRNIILIIYDKIMLNDISNNLFKQIISLPYHYYSNRTTGEVVSHFDAALKIKDTVINLFFMMFIDFPLSFLSIIIIYIINKDIGMFLLIITLIYILLILITKKDLKNNITKMYNRRSKMTSYLIESISGFETIKGLNLIKKVEKNFKNKTILFNQSLFNLDSIQNFQNIIKDIIRNFSEIIIIYIGCIMILENKMTIGELIAITSLMGYFLNPLETLPDLLIKISDAKEALKKVKDLFYYKNKEEVLKLKPTGNIIINNLDFSYDNVKPILKKINLTINQSDKILLIGKSGSGKSTLLKLLMKYYDINREMVFINNEDINDYSNDNYYSNIAYISQNEFIFNDTFINNINLTEQNNKKITKISKLCFVEEILNKQLGYNTLIEENGFNLSGGERQRLILARTLLKETNYILIDEGLSQMDVNLERKILKGIFNTYPKTTIILTSHRLDNMDLFDKVVKLENGVIKEVLKKGG